MNNAILIQSCDNRYSQMLSVVRALHWSYCERHGFDYDCAVAHTCDGEWDKLTRLRYYVDNSDYEYIVLADVDVMIVDPSVDLRDALPVDKWCGMAKHSGKRYGRQWHWNNGLVYLRGGRTARSFFHQVNQIWRDGASEMQEAIHYALDAYPVAERGIHELEPRFHANWTDPIADPVVMAWHGWENVSRRSDAMWKSLLDLRERKLDWHVNHVREVVNAG
jgi:hypothetical protein